MKCKYHSGRKNAGAAECNRYNDYVIQTGCNQSICSTDL